jgi:hypothetical protein
LNKNFSLFFSKDTMELSFGVTLKTLAVLKRGRVR